MEKNTLYFILCGTLIFLSSTVYCQSKRANEIGNSDYESNLRETLSRLESNSRFDYVSKQLDEQLVNNVLNVKILNKTFSDYVRSEKDTALRFLSAGCFLYRTGEVDSALSYLSSSSEMLIAVGEDQLASESFNELGNAYFTGGKFNFAVSAFLNSLKVGHDSDDETAQFNALLGLGRSYFAVGDTTLGVKLLNKYLIRSLDLKKHEATSNAFGALGIVFQDIGDHQMADYYFKKSYEFAIKSPSVNMKANAYTNKAIICFNNGSVDSAQWLFLEALELRKNLGSSRPIVDSYFNLASFKVLIKDYKTAEDYVLEGIKLSKENGLKIEEIDFVELLIEIYRFQNINDSVLSLQEELKSLKIMQDYNNQIDPISTGIVSVILQNENTLPIDPNSNRNNWIYQIIAIGALLVFAFGFLLVSSRKVN